MELTTTREFRKHRVLGDVYAVEFINGEGPRMVAAAKRCTRPEELTGGALPVLHLVDYDASQFYGANEAEFDLWEPPMIDTEKLAAILAAEHCCQGTESEWQRCDKAAKAAKKLYEKACDDLRRVVREAEEDPKAFPLLALADMPNTEPTETEGFDADMEKFDDRDDGNSADAH